METKCYQIFNLFSLLIHTKFFILKTIPKIFRESRELHLDKKLFFLISQPERHRVWLLFFFP